MGALVSCTAPTFARTGDILNSRQSAAPSQDSKKATNQVADTKIVTDGTGRSVAIPVNVRRIVSLAPNLTETEDALGLEDKLAGDTTYCDTPSAANDKPHVGAPVNPSLEAIVALHPDLVLATTSINRRETVDGLARLGIAVFTTDPHTISGMLESTTLLGNLMGANEEGTALVAKLQTRLDELQTRLRERPLVHVLFVVWDDPPISIGQNTFIADALRWAGAESVLISDQDWPHVSMEEIVRLQPEYIVLAKNHSESDASNQVSDLAKRPAWNQLEAMKLGHVVVVGDEVTRPSPGLVEVIEQLAHDLHPGLFGASEKISGLYETVPSELVSACAL